MKKQWFFKPLPDKLVVKNLCNDLNVSNVVSTIIAQRGIKTFDEAKFFFRPSLDNLHDPFLLKDMERAVKRILLALKKNENILLYGDYDVDGTTAVALLYDYLCLFTSNVQYYIPDRYSEGYGISEKGIRWAASEKINLVISLDCGIRANKNIDIANSLGIDVIICDHHEAGIELPKAFAIINPKRLDCSYPFDGLSGCGVGFKLIQAISQFYKVSQKTLYGYLDLVAISIAADIVSITGENRIMMYYGLKILNDNPRMGLRALIKSSGNLDTLTVSKIAFSLAPRINAAGRLDHASLAVRLLIEKDEFGALALANILNEKNSERKDIDSNITEEAINLIEANKNFISANTTTLYKENWHKGVIGIVASRCIEKYYRPTIILTKSNNMATGSVRSVPGYNVYDALCKCSALLKKFGGHKYAAGLTLEINKINEFRDQFEQIVSDTISQDQLIPKQNIDYKINIKDINYNIYKIIHQMAPFGPGNAIPIFASEYLIAKQYKILKNKHIKMILCHKGENYVMEAIGFNMSEMEKYISSRKIFKIAYKLEENEYFGNVKLQLNIQDIQPM